VLLPFCGNNDPKEQPNGGVARVATAKTVPQRIEPKQWCDRYYEPGTGGRVVLPPTGTKEPMSLEMLGSETSWTWLNLWATWCAPCLREMPLIIRWVDILGREGHAIDLKFLSLDEDPEQLKRFLSDHPDIAQHGTLQLSKGAQIQSWLADYQVAEETSIPIQFIVAPKGELRCVRYGAMADSDFQIVRALLKQK
jgi:thiol-disulfide isomerase/thioredoxin